MTTGRINQVVTCVRRPPRQAPKGCARGVARPHRDARAGSPQRVPEPGL